MISQTDLRQIRELETILQDHMESFGYRLIDVPMIANADIFLTRAGDTIIEELFTFERFGQLLALRPEFTAAVANRYARSGETKPVRWQMSGAIFIDQPSDYSLQYQQHNIGAELIGQAGMMADAEVLALAASGVDRLHVPDWELVVGHVGLQLHLLSQFNLDSRTYRILLTQRDRLKTDGKQAVLEHLKGILDIVPDEEALPAGDGIETQQVLDVLLDSNRYGSTMGGRTRHDIMNRLLKKHDRGLEHQQISDALDFLLAWGGTKGKLAQISDDIRQFIAVDDLIGQRLFADWLTTLDYVTAYGVPEDRIVLQPDLTKNWDYYTGIVFGVRSKDRYVASGGRYDGLIQLLGSEEAFPAVGYAYYTQALIDSMDMAPNKAPIITLQANDSIAAIRWANYLRQHQISVEIVSDEADVIVSGEQAAYQNMTLSQDKLVEELSK
ncbi:MAG: ATP phosphoribosyltransferase regulatory subunit [Anaerolineae bacterium]